MTAFLALSSAPPASDPCNPVSKLCELAKAGDAEAQGAIGNIYFHQNRFSGAAKWWRLCADQGDASCQGDLGTLYEFGLGVPKDYVEAYKWMNLGAAHGALIAPNDREEVARLMTPAQVAEAQRRSAEWKPATWLPRLFGSGRGSP